AQPGPGVAAVALRAAPGVEVVRAHRRAEPGLLGALDQAQQGVGRELFVRGVVADPGHGAQSAAKAIVVINAFSAWRESRRVCWTTIGTSDSITLANGVSFGIGSGSSSALKRRWSVRRGATVTVYGPAGSRSAKNTVMRTVASASPACGMRLVWWRPSCGAGPCLPAGMWPAAIAERLRPIGAMHGALQGPCAGGVMTQAKKSPAGAGLRPGVPGATFGVTR